MGADGTGEAWYLDMQADARTPTARELTLEPGVIWPTISPDGRWIAYYAWPSENPGLFVQRFPDGGSRQRVSPEETVECRWSADGRELFYRVDEGTGVSAIKVLPVETDPELRLGEPKELFRGEFQKSNEAGLSLAVWPDGQSLLLVPEELPLNEARELIVVQNWFREIEAIAPVNP